MVGCFLLPPFATLRPCPPRAPPPHGPHVAVPVCRLLHCSLRQPLRPLDITELSGPTHRAAPCGGGDMNDGSPRAGGGRSGNSVVDIYPLSRYYFGSKQAAPEKDGTPADRVQRLKSNFAAHGLRTCVGGVILVELFQQPHVLLLQVRNSFFRLPGGRLRPGESDDDGLKRKLSSKLSASESGEDDDWQTGECLGIWWRSDFETLPIPFLPSPVRKPKECTKLFLVRLPMHRQFIVPKNLKLLAVPLCQIHDDSETYGPIISGIPQLLSRFSFNMVRA